MQYGTTSDYSTSYVKTTVDAWKIEQAPAAIEVRLITLDDLTDNLGYEYNDSNPTSKYYNKTTTTPCWVYNSNYSYWVSSQYNDLSSDVWYVSSNGDLYSISVNYDGGGNGGKVRPVIVLPKSALSA